MESCDAAQVVWRHLVPAIDWANRINLYAVVEKLALAQPFRADVGRASPYVWGSSNDNLFDQVIVRQLAEREVGYRRP